jgi:hypothetical protein
MKAQFDGQCDSAFYPLTDHFGTQALAEYFRALTITSGFAAQFAFFNTASRYVLPRPRARPTHLAGHDPPQAP